MTAPILRATLLGLVLGALPAPAPGGPDAPELVVVGVEPVARTLSAAIGTSVRVQFDQPVDRTTVTPERFRVFGRWSGGATGTIGFADDDHAIVLTPDQPFSAGELVTVFLANGLRGSDGSPMREGGYCFQFWTRAEAASRAFTEVQTLSTNAGNESSRPYGGIGSDLDGDGWLDLAIVNEDTADVRVFLNTGDGSGEFTTFLHPPPAVNDRASPSEPADFNGDGVIDICTANINTSSVSVLLGNGDGTFAPQQEISVGAAPRGIAVLDVDGDGDVDIVNTNADSSSLSLMLNDGLGSFGPPSFFEGGGSGEWAVAAADMDEDGLLDLVVGARSSQTILVLRGQGDGSFVHVTTRSAGGPVWMLVVGDVNGDGHEDVATANSSTNNGAILLGDGAGGLAPPVTRPADPFPLATDLGDLDGDGDLDWSLSSFAGDWWLYENDGNGAFTFDQELDAPANASCSILLDVDNDRDLDIALIDEIADVVIIMRNDGIADRADVNGDGSVDVDDLVIVILAWGSCPAGPCPADVDGSGRVDADDLVAVILAWS